MADFATWEDVQARWRSLTSEEQATATVHLGDASSLLRVLVKDIDDRIEEDDAAAAAAGTADPDGHGDLYRVVKAKIAGVVKRYMENPQGAKQMQRTIGNRNLGMTLPDGSATGVFFTEDELAALRTDTGAPTPAFGTAYVGIRPGWGPPCPPGPGWWPTS